MKVNVAVLGLLMVNIVHGDMFLHNPRGSNNRLNGNKAARSNANRLFDSQSNANGGYNVGDRFASASGSNQAYQYNMEGTGSVFYGYGVKQCAFKPPTPNVNKQNGQIQTCDFQKTYSNSALRVTFQGDLRLISCSGPCCRRWYITINGKECSSPAPIDAIIYTHGVSNFNLHRPGTLDGFCSNIPAGRVAVGLSVGKCNNYPNVGYVHTCWNSVCRLIIEEAPLVH